MNKILLLLYKASAAHLSKLKVIAPDWEILHTIEKKEAIHLIKEAEVVMGNHFLSESLPYNNKTIKWIQTNSTGIDFIIKQCGSLLQNITLTNAKGVYDEEMSEHTIALLLSLNRNLHHIRDAQNNQSWERQIQLSSLKNKVVLILGHGSLGNCISKKLTAFGCTIYGITSSVQHVHINNKMVHWKDMLSDIDILITCLPYTKETQNYIGENELKKLPSSALVINVGRSETLDEKALYDLLKNKLLRGAALDVFTEEPLAPNHTAWNISNLIVSPHTSRSKEIEPPFQFETLFEENFKRYINGLPLINIVDVNKGY
jgi:D-2-hydroxyacid dehydrogenase (NADP+)